MASPNFPPLDADALKRSPNRPPIDLGGDPGVRFPPFVFKAKRHVDFADVAKRLDGVEADAKARLRELLKRARDDFIAGIPARLDAKKINDLTLPRTTLGKALADMLASAFDQGREDIRSETIVKVHAAKPTMVPKAAMKYLKEKAFWASGILEDDLLKGAKGVLMQALRNGEGTAETMRKIRDVWLPYLGDETIIEDEQQLTAPRLETIVRTNTTDAYNNGRLVEMRDPDLEGFINGVEYSAIIDSRTTELCQHLDGKVFRVDDPDLDKFTPPNHYNCRSILVPIMVDEPIDAADLITATDKGIALDMMDKSFGGDARFAYDINHSPVEEVHVVWVDGKAFVPFEWDESKHPRVPAGSSGGGQFGSGGGTAIDESVVQKILRVDKENGVEHATLIDKNGNLVVDSDGAVVLDRDGEDHAVTFTDDEVASMRGGVLVHNHPNLSSLSIGDLRMSNTAQLKAIVAITADGGVYVGRARVSNDDLANAYEAADAVVYQRMFPVKVSWEASQHAVDSALGKAGAISYHALLGASMRAAIAAYDANTFVGGFDAMVDEAAARAKGTLPGI